MNRTIWKIFLSFVLLAAVISTILMCINFIGIAFVGSDSERIYPNSQRYLLGEISENLHISNQEISLTDTGIIPDDNWCILLDENGDIIWSHNKPDDIPGHYSINDVAKLTRWFLNDYPVYVRAEDYGLLILGIPKNAVGKYDIEYSMNWFDSLPERIIKVIAVNLLFAAALACLFGASLYRKLKLLTEGIGDLRQEKNVRMKEKGIFKDVIKNINDTSESIGRKNAALARRDNARSNWIAGISHDIRTPLSVIMGYSETLAASPELSGDNRKKAEVITFQSMKVRKLIEDLNLISSLEYDMQPFRKKEVRICPLLRSIVSDMINSGLEEKFEISLDLRYEQAVVMGDAALLERALFNLIDNSIKHNQDGCAVAVAEYAGQGNVFIKISDNGKGVSEEVIRNMGSIPKTAHGLGLPMAYRIISVHGGKMMVRNENGFSALMELPIK